MPDEHLHSSRSSLVTERTYAGSSVWAGVANAVMIPAIHCSEGLRQGKKDQQPGSNTCSHRTIILLLYLHCFCISLSPHLLLLPPSSCILHSLLSTLFFFFSSSTPLCWHPHLYPTNFSLNSSFPTYVSILWPCTLFLHCALSSHLPCTTFLWPSVHPAYFPWILNSSIVMPLHFEMASAGKVHGLAFWFDVHFIGSV